MQGQAVPIGRLQLLTRSACTRDEYVMRLDQAAAVTGFCYLSARVG